MSATFADVDAVALVRLEFDQPRETAGDLLDLRRALHRGEVFGGLPIQVGLIARLASASR